MLGFGIRSIAGDLNTFSLEQETLFFNILSVVSLNIMANIKHKNVTIQFVEK